jgi:hypothetical protein
MPCLKMYTADCVYILTHETMRHFDQSSAKGATVIGKRCSSHEIPFSTFEVILKSSAVCKVILEYINIFNAVNRLSVTYFSN